MTRRPPHGPGADVSGRNDTTLERRRGGGSRGSGRHRPADSITRGPPSGRPAGRPGILHLMLDHRVGPARIMAGRDRRRRRRRASVATRGVSLRAWFGVPLTGTAQVIAGCTVAVQGHADLKQPADDVLVQVPGDPIPVGQHIRVVTRPPVTDAPQGQPGLPRRTRPAGPGPVRRRRVDS